MCFTSCVLACCHSFMAILKKRTLHEPNVCQVTIFALDTEKVVAAQTNVTLGASVSLVSDTKTIVQFIIR